MCLGFQMKKSPQSFRDARRHLDWKVERALLATLRRDWCDAVDAEENLRIIVKSLTPK